MYRFDDFLADPENWRLSQGEREIHLEPLVLELLIYLIANRGRLVTRQELMETVRSQGYRFIAAVEEIDHPDGRDPTSRKAHARPVGGRLVAGIAAIVTLVIAAAFWSRMPHDEPRQEKVIRSLAVLPLNNLTGDAEQDYYVDGLQEILITELSRIPDLRVTSRQSTVRYRNSRGTWRGCPGRG